MGERVAVDLVPTRWGSQPYPPNGYLTRRSRLVTVARGYPESDSGFKVVRQIAASVVQKPGASWVHSGVSGERTIVYYFNTALYYDEDDASPVSIKTGLTATYVPMLANMGSPTGMSIFVNGTDAPVLIRDNGTSTLEAVPANLEKPDGNWTASGNAGGGALPNGTYYIKIAQVEVDSVTGTIRSGPATTKTVTLAGANTRISVAHATWVPNARTTHWRVGISNTTDSPENYFYDADIVIATTSTNIDAMPTNTPAFESRNGFYKVTDLTEIISGKHPRGMIAYEGRFIAWYKNDARIVWSERDEWGWYSTNGLDTGAEGGWNLPVRSLVPYLGNLLVFTEAAVHAVFGNFKRDLDGVAPTYEAQAIPKTLIQGIGLLGGPESVRIGSDGRVYFISTSGPAVFSGKLDLLEPEDMRLDWNSLDKSSGYPERWMIVEDPDTGSIWFGMTRKTNASRPLDGASVAGIVDTWWRWLYRRNVWDVPYQLDLTHLAYRTNGTVASAASASGGPLLMGVNHCGTVVQLGFGAAGGDPDGVVTASDYDGKLASSNTTLTATIALAGIAADALIGQTISLRYPSTDGAYPYRVIQKTISDNTATSGGNVTITWEGAETVPTTSFWTVRLAGRLLRCRVSVDPRMFQIPGASPASYYQLHQVELRLKDKVGAEAIA